MRAELNFRKLGDQGEPLIILHGLFGSSDNWQSLGKQWAEDFQVYLIDQRNHGRSEHTLVHGYESMAEDLDSFMDENEIEAAHILGHSMGGKTAMRFAQMFEERVLSLIVADMGIKEYSPQHDHILEALNDIDPSNLKSRSEAEESLRKDLKIEGVVQFLLKNLYRRKEGGYNWRFNLPVLEASMSDILEELPPVSVDKPTLFIRGSESNYVNDEDWSEIKNLFPQAHLETLEKAGHWLHADQPDKFYKLVGNFLLKKS